MDTLIQAKVLKGFRDFLPDAEIKRALLIEKLTQTFRTYGFVPIDTPVLEYAEILLRKSSGETEKQIFRFTDNGGRDVALRFDLTVPFARFIAEHKDELYFPFKRYHIAKVWRGEKPQAGRYREFVQCDFDIVGSDSAASDFEILALIKEALKQIGAKNITIRINHRGVFNAFLAKLQLSSKSDDILRIVDKLAKIGKDEVKEQLNQICKSDKKAQDILTYVGGSSDFESTLELIKNMAGVDESKEHSSQAAEGIERLKQIRSLMDAAGIASTFVLDPSITRGLDYYTGLVYETFLNDLPSIGSVCSGGRYDGLTALYMKERISGAGSSIGLDRLLAALEQLGQSEKTAGFLDAEIFCLDAGLAADYQGLLCHLRKAGLHAEAFPDAKKMNQQYVFAEKKNIPFGILMTKEDAAKGVLTLKNLQNRIQYEGISADEAIKIIKNEKT